MNKAELVEFIVKSKTNGIETKAAAERAVETVLNGIRHGLKKGAKKVSLFGFGTFSVVKRKARMGRNPSTGGPMRIGAYKTVTFKVSKTLKQIL